MSNSNLDPETSPQPLQPCSHVPNNIIAPYKDRSTGPDTCRPAATNQSSQAEWVFVFQSTALHFGLRPAPH